MDIVALTFAALAALVHVYIFYLESIVWTSKKARAVFGTTAEEAQITRALAFNQGFYNLFLAIVVIIGIGFMGAGESEIGATAIIIGAGSMTAAALVLLLSNPGKRKAAMTQGAFPLLCLITLTIALMVR